MRKKLYVFASILLVFCSLFLTTQGVVAADDGTMSPKVSVYGEACVEVAPDKAVLYGTVQATGDNETTVKDELTANYNSLKETLSLDENAVKITGYHFNASSNFGQVSHYGCLNFSITLDETQQVEEVSNKIWETDHSKVHNICYEVSDNNSAYAQALAEAVQNAKNKASIVLGESALNVVEIIEESNFCGASLYRTANETFDNTDLIQNVSVCARVRVVFE